MMAQCGQNRGALRPIHQVALARLIHMLLRRHLRGALRRLLCGHPLDVSPVSRQPLVHFLFDQPSLLPENNYSKL